MKVIFCIVFWTADRKMKKNTIKSSIVSLVLILWSFFNGFVAILEKLLVAALLKRYKSFFTGFYKVENAVLFLGARWQSWKWIRSSKNCEMGFLNKVKQGMFCLKVAQRKQYKIYNNLKKMRKFRILQFFPK